MNRVFSLRVFLVLACLQGILFTSCSDKSDKKPSSLFTLIDESQSGINFSNDLKFDQRFNIYTYRNFYNGGGVALGDINNDGLIDIYFTANQKGNKLYLNKGNFEFDDITAKAGVGGNQNWSTGVSMADVNGDGWLDIYVCSSGNVEGDPDKQNELFINNGDLTFSEKAKEYGIADKGYSTHAAFFDYDKDGDMDLYILNNSYQAIGSFNLRKNIRNKRDALGGHKLLRNDNNHFTDVSEEAGIYGSVIGFGLGVTVGDINKDGWLDIFVSNDFFERDYLYINNKNGSFRECLPEQMKSISGASMGADLADINNDGWSDLFVTEMLPKDNARQKTLTTFEDWNRYRYNVENDYHHQFTRNMLQMNNADGTFSEIGRLAGVEATDWSWGALMFDMDNDGLKDIFVANGIYQDLTNQDFLQFASNEEFVKSVLSKNTVDYKKLTEIIPSNPIPNFAFQNRGNFSFSDKAAEWGLATPGFSNGSAYGDIDNDGDLDLVVNNVNMTSFVYRNETDKILPKNHYLKFILKGEGKNTHAVGTKITAEAGGKKFYVEQVPIRGFESTIDARPNIGLGQIAIVDKITIEWPDDRITVLDSVKANQILTLHQKDAQGRELVSEPSPKPIFSPVPDKRGIDFVHKENTFVDFDRDYLIYHMISTEGPRVSKADVNGDGLEDFFIGGAKGISGALYIQNTNGTFRVSSKAVFHQDKDSEDMGSEFFDADMDGDPDLYVCSGGNEFSSSSASLLDRLYINDGKGLFRKAEHGLPAAFESSSTVRSADYDNDGDPDLFVGTRVKPFYYGLPMNGYILNNNGRGQFSNVSNAVAPALQRLGMITDASWADIDQDKDHDLVIVGEFMPITVLVNDNGKFTERTSQAGLQRSNGWWNRIEAADLDDDGDIDFVAGNHGLNSRFQANSSRPVEMYINDFDQNGTIEHIVTSYQGSKSYPLVLKHELINQIPSLKKKYLKYENYKNETINDIFTPEQLKNAVKLQAFEFSTSVFLNDGKGKFVLKPLPVIAQLSPVYGIEIGDFDSDGKKDIVLGGNLFETKPQVGRYDASYGLFLKGLGHGEFESVPSKQSGIRIDGQVRDLVAISGKNNKELILLVSRNADSVITYTINRQK
jgi:enediyne biosynthesis protein E4